MSEITPPCRWIVGEDPFTAQGYIFHMQVPVFRAKWGRETGGAAGFVFSDIQPDPEENMCFWEFVFEGDEPSTETIRKVCTTGLDAIDTYLVNISAQADDIVSDILSEE